MLIGYTRVATGRQDLGSQLRGLGGLGVDRERIHREDSCPSGALGHILGLPSGLGLPRPLPKIASPACESSSLQATVAWVTLEWEHDSIAAGEDF